MVVAIALSTPAAAQTLDNQWNHPGPAVGDWFQANRWLVPLLPDSSDVVAIDNGGTAEIAVGDAVAGTLYVDFNNALTSDVLLMTSGTLTVGGFFVGHDGNGTFTVNGGTVSAGVMTVGKNSGSVGSVIQNGGSVSTSSSADLILGSGAGASGSYQLNGGTLSIGNRSLEFGTFNDGGTGTYVQTGGTLSATRVEAEDTPGSTFTLQGGDVQISFAMIWGTSGGKFAVVEGGMGGDCPRCDRLRLTSDGRMRPCLFSDLSFSVRELGAAGALRRAVHQKPRSGASAHGYPMYAIGG